MKWKKTIGSEKMNIANDERFLILGYVVVMYIIALLPIRRAFGIALLFVACSVFILLERGKM